MTGFEGKILDVDLTTGDIKESSIDKDTLRKYIGGSGLAAKLFLDRVDPQADPLSAGNILFFMTGPVSGSNFPGGARFAVCAKSPLTGIWGEACCGGNFAHALKCAGYDGIAVNGVSDKPVYLAVKDSKIEIKDAAGLWGKDIYDTVAAVKEKEDRKASVVAIGQAGENRVKFAVIGNEGSNVAGRSGLGAVMGSKKLKAIAVQGSGKYTPAFPDDYSNIRKELTARSKENIVTQYLNAQGTNAAMGLGALTGDLPARNWAGVENAELAGAIGGDALTEKYLTKTHACFGCAVGCKRVCAVPDGPYQMDEGAGPEYEGTASFGSLLEIDDLAALVKINEVCNRYGMDVISCGASIAFAMDCLENGLISTKDTDGVELKWGNADAVLQMVEKIARRDGFGDMLAEGSRRAAVQIGRNAADYAIEVKGLEVPMHDPRAGHGIGLAYAVGVRGACHVNDMTWSAEGNLINNPEIGLPGGVTGKTSEGKAELVRASQDLGMVVNSAIICYMLMPILAVDDWVQMLRVTSGFDYDHKELMECGARVWYLKRGLDNLMGVRAEDDRLPQRLLTPKSEGGAAGSAPDIALMLKEFYAIRDLDAQGRPSKQRLESLGLSDLAARLYG